MADGLSAESFAADLAAPEAPSAPPVSEPQPVADEKPAAPEISAEPVQEVTEEDRLKGISEALDKAGLPNRKEQVARWYKDAQKSREELTKLRKEYEPYETTRKEAETLLASAPESIRDECKEFLANEGPNAFIRAFKDWEKRQQQDDPNSYKVQQMERKLTALEAERETEKRKTELEAARKTFELERDTALRALGVTDSEETEAVKEEAEARYFLGLVRLQDKGEDPNTLRIADCVSKVVKTRASLREKWEKSLKESFLSKKTQTTQRRETPPEKAEKTEEKSSHDILKEAFDEEFAGEG